MMGDLLDANQKQNVEVNLSEKETELLTVIYSISKGVSNICTEPPRVFGAKVAVAESTLYGLIRQLEIKGVIMRGFHGSITAYKSTQVTAHGIAVLSKLGITSKEEIQIPDRKEEKAKLKRNFTSRRLAKKIHKNLAKQLALIIEENKSVNISKTIVTNWAEELYKLNATDGISTRRQERILRWYQTAIGGTYIPVVESGKSFREKFLRLESAKLREQTQFIPKKRTKKKKKKEKKKKNKKTPIQINGNDIIKLLKSKKIVITISNKK